MPMYAQKAASYRHYCTIEECVKTGEGDRGQDILSWNALYNNVPIGIESLSGRKAELAKQLVSSATHTVCLRYKPLSVKTHRFNFDGRIFRIGYISDIEERHRYLECTVTEEGTV